MRSSDSAGTTSAAVAYASASTSSTSSTSSRTYRASAPGYGGRVGIRPPVAGMVLRALRASDHTDDPHNTDDTPRFQETHRTPSQVEHRSSERTRLKDKRLSV